MIAEEKFFPTKYDLANDDDHLHDGPNALGQMFVVDAPGYRGMPPDIIAGVPIVVAQMGINLESFIRVSFNGVRPAGNAIVGSRASNKADWHVIINIIRDAGGWKVAAPGAMTAGVDHVPLPTPQGNRI